VKTNSIFPAILFHFTHNSLAVLSGFATPQAVETNSVLSWLFIPAADLFHHVPLLKELLGEAIAGDQLVYNPLAVLLALSAAGGILYWLKRLPYHSLAEEQLQELLSQQGTCRTGFPVRPETA